MAWSYSDHSVTPSQAGINANGASGSFNYTGPNVSLAHGSSSAAFWASRDSSAWGFGPGTAASGGQAASLAPLLLLGLVAAFMIAKRKG